MNNLIRLKEEFINKKLDEFTEECASGIQWKDFQSSPLGPVIPASMIRENFKTLFKTVLDKKRDGERIARGVEIIDQNLGSLPNEELCRKDLRQSAERISKNLLAAMQKFDKNPDPEDAETLKWMGADKNKKFETIGDLLGFSPETCKSFYEIGSNLFKEKQYEDACCVFLFLSLLQPYTYEVWVSLGLCHQHLEDWFSAVYCFSLASVMNPDHIDPYIYGAECFLAANDKKNAKGNLEIARHFLTPENRNVYEPLIDHLLKQIE